MRDECGSSGVAHVQQCDAAIAPGAVGHVVADDGVMQGDSVLPRRLFTARFPHARQPPSAHLPRARRIEHVNADQDVIGIAIEKRRSIGVATSDPPHAMQSEPLDTHEADGLRFGRL